MKQRVLHELREAWNKLLHWELPSFDDQRPRPDLTTPRRQTSATSTLNLTGIGDAEECRRSASGVAAASSKLGTLGSDVSKLCDRLLNRFVRRVTRDPSARVHVVSTQHARAASIATAATTPPSPAMPVPDLSDVFDKLEQIFSFIGGALANVRLTDEVDSTAEGPAVPPGPDSLAGKLGEELMDKVFDCVYADCLSHIVQSSDTSWPTLDKILQLSERFQTNITRHLQLQVSDGSLNCISQCVNYIVLKHTVYRTVATGNSCERNGQENR